MQFSLLALFLLTPLFLFCSPLKVLHLTFHRGCATEIEMVSQKLSLDLTTWCIQDLPPYFFDELSKGNVLYNIGHDRAERIWSKHQHYFESFDVIITSDIAPLSRIFLQNKWEKPLIIWVCNRFDYCDRASLDCVFPDDEYYHLFSQAAEQKNVAIVAYTEFEHIYARSKGVHSGNITIQPSGAFVSQQVQSSVPENIVKEETFFLPPYHNETIFMNLSEYCTKLGIKSYCGHYNGPNDLQDFKGMIHVPYAWSNFALFENMHLGIPYFVPSPIFMARLISKGAHFQDAHLAKKHLNACEWYSGKYTPFIVYFESWDDLVVKLRTYDYLGNRQKILDLAKQHDEKTFSLWRTIFNNLLTTQSRETYAN
jgi:hypothetical protein